MALHSTEEIIADIKQGKMVILMDDEDRENEGDLIMAASHVQAEHINFMARYGRGLICLTLTPQRCRQLQLPLMVSNTNAKQSTNFTVSIEAAEGVTTGISAADRARTVQAAVAANAGPNDIVQPGHIFPLMAQPGGVLTRAGHTEAGCDLVRLAGLEPAAVIVEILNEDGTMARLPELKEFAAQHGLKIGTIADLIQYRLQNENTVTRMASCQVHNAFGAFEMVVYEDHNQRLHYALVKGDIDADIPVLVRVHMQDPVADWMQVNMPDGGWPLYRAMARISSESEGVLLVLTSQYNNHEIVRRVRQCHLHLEKGKEPERDSEWYLRTYGIGAQILVDLGLRKMRVLSVPKKVHGLSGFGLEIIEYVACENT